MGDKCKPWHRESKRSKDRDHDKRISPLRSDRDKRIVPLRVGGGKVIPLRAGNSFNLDEDDFYDLDQS